MTLQVVCWHGSCIEMVSASNGIIRAVAGIKLAILAILANLAILQYIQPSHTYMYTIQTNTNTPSIDV
jgi:hypothetical protein